jgi:uncharacterized protein (DUF885 family)
VSDTRAFYDQSFAGLLATTPEVAAELGIAEVAGHAIPQDRFSDISAEGDAHRQTLMAKALAKLRSLPAPLDPVEATNRTIYEYFLRWAKFGRLRGVEASAFAHCEPPVDHLSGPQAEMINCLTEWQPLRTPDDAEAFLARVAAMPRQIQRQLVGLTARASVGSVMPQVIVQRVVREVEGLLALPVDQHPVVVRYREARGEQGLPRLRALMEKEVAPAYRQLREYLLEYYPHEGQIGLWRLADGDACYRFHLKAHTTSDRGPDEIFALGNEELMRLQRETRQKLKALGFDAHTLGEGFRALDADPRFRFDKVNGARAEVLTQVRSILADTEARIRPNFGLWPRAVAEVREIPVVQERNRHSTYVPPAADGSRPGVFDVCISQVMAGNRLDLYTLVYHEVMPGHHVQLTIAQELGRQLPAFRRILTHDGFIEGWAKYSELLPRLEGLNVDPYWDLARSRNELYSTANLMMDTGIHAKRWSHEQSVTFFCENAGASRALADSIVDRSIVWPGQVSAYKTGLLAVLGARRRMEQALGAKFDLKRFHDVVLGSGSMPLALMDRAIDDEIARAAA